MNEEEYRKELAKTVLMFSQDIVEIVHRRIETYSKERFVCKRCNK